MKGKIIYEEEVCWFGACFDRFSARQFARILGKNGWRATHPWAQFTHADGTPIKRGEVLYFEPETVPDGLYEVTYIDVTMKDGKPGFYFGLLRPSTGDDWLKFDASDFNMKDGTWFGTDWIVRISNDGKDLTPVGPKPPKILATK